MIYVLIMMMRERFLGRERVLMYTMINSLITWIQVYNKVNANIPQRE